MVNNQKINSLEFLRGLAVLLVVLCHFGKPVSKGAVLPDLFRWLGYHGQYGVQIFFVISGFVIPYSLFKAKYVLKDYFRFLYKRFLRLHPPYLVALFITLIIAYLSYKARHLPFPESPLFIIESIFYIHAPNDNPVFWTLKVEAEYYIFIGLYFILLTKNQTITTIISVPALLLLSLTKAANYCSLLYYIPYFLLGTIGFSFYVELLNKYIAILTLVVLSIFCLKFVGMGASIAAVSTIVFILTYRKKLHYSLEYMGKISYSLYLIHFPIGIKLINLSNRYFSASYNWLIFILTLLLCVAISIIFWRFIEKPCAVLSNNIKYKMQEKKYKTLS